MTRKTIGAGHAIGDDDYSDGDTEEHPQVIDDGGDMQQGAFKNDDSQMNQPPATQSINKTLTALERTTQIRNRRDKGKMSEDEDDEQILDNTPMRTNKYAPDDRLLDTGHNR